ncbi:hypothetical protein M0P48_00485 [Candidatus Gracilibacteria bacterium]|jgi:predicted RNA-binding protein with RPS1 domain|nr:hypothetical protein [Candidatus Gracilibacteria bacterium]
MNMSLSRSPEDIEAPKTFKVTGVDTFGLFLEDGGFVHISKISDFHKGSLFSLGELNKWYPIGSSVVVKLEKEEKLVNGKKRILYDFMGPGNIIDVNAEVS